MKKMDNKEIKLRVVDRRGSDSYKWDSAHGDDVLPLWVADMDFEAAPPIMEALRRRVEHGVFGYTRVPEEYYDSVIRWFAGRHHWTMRREEMIYTTGVVPALSAIIQALTTPGDKVLAFTPVYNCFFSSIRNSGCQLAPCPLRPVTDPCAEGDLRWEADFDEMERQAATPRTRLFLMCNPHNPVGHAWTPDELRRMGEICLRHNVFVVADEIHNELVMPGHTYTPYASLGEPYASRCAVCHSPSKSFNIAGLQIANITIADEEVRRRVDKQININEVCDVNPFGVCALQAAYTPEGAQWLDALNAHISRQFGRLLHHVRHHMPLLRVSRLEATYLAWVDFSALAKDSAVMEEELLERHHLWLNAGGMYDPAPSQYMRINLACSTQTLDEALRRLQEYYDTETRQHKKTTTV